MAEKKEWCAYSGRTSCNCSKGECWALENRELIDGLNTLLSYGLTIDEAAADMNATSTKEG